MKVLPNLLLSLSLLVPLTALGVSADGGEDESLCPSAYTELAGSVLATVDAEGAHWYHHTFTYDFLTPDQHVTFHVAGVGGGWVQALVYAHDDCSTPLDCGRDVHYDATVGLVSGQTCTVGPGGHFVQVVWKEPADVAPGAVDYLLTAKQW